VVAVEPWVAEVAALTAVYLGPQQLLVLAQVVPVEGADLLTGVARSQRQNSRPSSRATQLQGTAGAPVRAAWRDPASSD
jgi:hypothetical protein